MRQRGNVCVGVPLVLCARVFCLLVCLEAAKRSSLTSESPRGARRPGNACARAGPNEVVFMISSRNAAAVPGGPSLVRAAHVPAGACPRSPAAPPRRGQPKTMPLTWFFLCLVSATATMLGAPAAGDESLMDSGAYGSCAGPVQRDLRWAVDRALATQIGCRTRRAAERSGYWKTTTFPDEVEALSAEDPRVIFRDSVARGAESPKRSRRRRTRFAAPPRERARVLRQPYRCFADRPTTSRRRRDVATPRTRRRSRASRSSGRRRAGRWTHS